MRSDEVNAKYMRGYMAYSFIPERQKGKNSKYCQI